MRRERFGKGSGQSRFPKDVMPDAPLIIAIHGGTYDSRYFDVPDFSLLDRAAANMLPIIAIDRPGYGDTPLLPQGDMHFAGQARFLTDALEEIWQSHGEGRPGIVIIAHSIGAAIALHLAGTASNLPLLGISVSGICMRTPIEHRTAWDGLGEAEIVTMPDDIKDMVMFGPEGSFAPEAPAAARIANTSAPKAELIEITGRWHEQTDAVLGRITIPIHYRQGEGDRLWIVNEGEVHSFEKALTQAPNIDAAMLRNTGHCLDFHRIGAAFQLDQLAFALRCAVEAF